MTVAPPSGAGGDRGVVRACRRRGLRRLLAAIDRRALVCGARRPRRPRRCSSWYVAWHVPTLGVALREPLRRRVQGPHLPDQRRLRRVRHGGVLYSPKIDHARSTSSTRPPRSGCSGRSPGSGRSPASCSGRSRRSLALAWMIASAAHGSRAGGAGAKAWAVSLLVATPLSRARAAARRRAPRARPGRALPRGARRRSTSCASATARARRPHRHHRGAQALPDRLLRDLRAAPRVARARQRRSAALVATTAIAWVVLPVATARRTSSTGSSAGCELRHYWHNAHWISSSSSLYTLFFRQPFTGTAPERVARASRCASRSSRLGVYAAWRQLREGREVGALLCVALASTDRLAGRVGPLLHLGRARPVRARRARSRCRGGGSTSLGLLRAHLPRAAAARAQREPLAQGLRLDLRRHLHGAQRADRRCRSCGSSSRSIPWRWPDARSAEARRAPVAPGAQRGVARRRACARAARRPRRATGTTTSALALVAARPVARPSPSSHQWCE